MRIIPFALSSVLLAVLAACGGGADQGQAQSAGASSAVTTVNTGTTAPVTVPAAPLLQLAPGSSHTMLAGETILVPAGAVVTTVEHSTVTLNGHNNTVSVSAGASVVVPATASGPADNMVVASGGTGPAVSLIYPAELLAGGGAIGDTTVVDGAGDQARFDAIGQLALDSSGNLYASGRNAVRRISPSGVVSTLPGSVAVSGLAVGGDTLYGGGSYDGVLYRGNASDGLKPWVTSNFSGGRLAADGSGNVYVADFDGKRVLKFDASGAMSVLVGTTAGLHGPSALVLDRSGTLLVDDRDRVVKVHADGSFDTLAAVPSRIIPSDGAMAVDAGGNVYVATDSDIRLIAPDGSVTPVRMSSGNAPFFTTYIVAMVALPSGGLYVGTGWAAPSQIWKLKF